MRWEGYVRPQCAVDACTTLASSRGFCRTHYTRWIRHGDPTKLGHRSEAKIAASIRNAKLATAAVQKEISERPRWKCEQCGIEKPGGRIWAAKKYCSRKCQGEAFRYRMLGKNNPHYQGVSEPRACPTCGKLFSGQFRGRKYCSRSCKAKSPQAIEHVKRVGLIGAARAAIVMREAYMRNPWRMPGRKDDNHSEVEETLIRLGCSVRDTSTLAAGFPDLLVGLIGQDHLVEIKNRKTKYGRNGLNKAQKEFRDSWRGSKVVVLHDSEEAEAWVKQVRLQAWP